MNQNLQTQANVNNAVGISFKTGEVSATGKSAQTLILGMLSIASLSFGVKQKNPYLLALGGVLAVATIYSGVK